MGRALSTKAAWVEGRVLAASGAATASPSSTTRSVSASAASSASTTAVKESCEGRRFGAQRRKNNLSLNLETVCCKKKCATIKSKKTHTPLNKCDSENTWQTLGGIMRTFLTQQLEDEPCGEWNAAYVCSGPCRDPSLFPFAPVHRPSRTPQRSRGRRVTRDPEHSPSQTPVTLP